MAGWSGGGQGAGVAFCFSRSAMGSDNLPALVAGLGVAMRGAANCGLQEICGGAERGISREFVVLTRLLRRLRCADYHSEQRSPVHSQDTSTASRGIEVLMPLFRFFPRLQALSVRVNGLLARGAVCPPQCRSTNGQYFLRALAAGMIFPKNPVIQRSGPTPFRLVRRTVVREK